MPGLDLPVEPSPPRRGAAALATVLAAALVVLALYLTIQGFTGARAEDPSLSASTGQGQQ